MINTTLYFELSTYITALREQTQIPHIMREFNSIFGIKNKCCLCIRKTGLLSRAGFKANDTSKTLELLPMCSRNPLLTDFKEVYLVNQRIPAAHITTCLVERFALVPKQKHS